MEYNEKNIDEYFNCEDIDFQIEIGSQIATIIGILIANNITTREEFDEAQKEIKKRTKEKIKQELKNMNEEVK